MLRRTRGTMGPSGILFLHFRKHVDIKYQKQTLMPPFGPHCRRSIYLIAALVYTIVPRTAHLCCPERHVSRRAPTTPLCRALAGGLKGRGVGTSIAYSTTHGARHIVA